MKTLLENLPNDGYITIYDDSGIRYYDLFNDLIKCYYTYNQYRFIIVTSNSKLFNDILSSEVFKNSVSYQKIDSCYHVKIELNEQAINIYLEIYLNKLKLFF